MEGPALGRKNELLVRAVLRVETAGHVDLLKTVSPIPKQMETAFIKRPDFNCSNPNPEFGYVRGIEIPGPQILEPKTRTANTP
jgi:hypothetical protein